MYSEEIIKKGLNAEPTSDSEVGVEKLVRRHFIVFYIATRKVDNALITGYMDFDSDTYLNKKLTTQQLKEKLPEAKDDIVFTNIIELNMADYKSWIE